MAAASFAAIEAHAQRAALPPYTARVRVDVAAEANAPKLAPELFGINWNWVDSGGGTIEFGEMVRDRSFRNQDDAAKRVWIESPNDGVGGRIEHVKTGGDDRPWSAKAYPGYLKLSQRAPGYTCVSQILYEELDAGARYDLHVSASGGTAAVTLAAFFSDERFMPIERVETKSVVGPRWASHALTLVPERRQAPAYVRICLASAGELSIDEVRLARSGRAPRVREAVAAKVRELGALSLRWPTGSDADYFDWRESIGTLRARGENPSAFGALETPSLGLHEFLDYCEAAGIVPLITVNVREPPERAAELVEYVLGAKTTTMGALRAANGREAPWDVRHFELGNEPVDVYRADFASSDAAKGYVRIASAASAAMRAKAAQLGKRIELKGVLETTFALSDWIRLVPMLSRWNATVLDPRAGLLPAIDQVKGNFYGPFNWRENERELFEEAMASGTTLAATLHKLDADFGTLPPFWLTEYSVMVQKKKLLFGTEILLERAKDYQTALVDADVLMTAMRERLGGAYLFNLAQWGTWGVIANPRDLRLRPSGLAFAMLAKLAGTRLLVPVVEGARTVVLSKGDGNNPAGTRYQTLAAVAGASADAVQVVLLNRSYATEERVRIDLAGFAPASVQIEQLGPFALIALNDERADTVTVARSPAAPRGTTQVVSLPPRTLMRLVYPRR